MSPFSNWLRGFRKARGLKQKDMAEQMGYEQSYVSALEVGIKGPPTTEFVEKLAGTFSLSDVEADRVRRAANMSARKLTIPVDADEQVYRLVYEVRQQMHTLLPSQVSMMMEILNMPHKMNEETKFLATEPMVKVSMKRRRMEVQNMK